MHKPLQFPRAGWALCAVAALLFGRPTQAEPLIMVANDWCPYSCGQTDARQGYVVDMMREIFAEVGVSVEYRVVPWSRAIKMVEQGKADILLATTFNDTPDLPLSQTIGVDTSCFYVKQDSPVQDPDIAQIKQLRLGVIQDFSYDNGGALDSHIASPDLQDGRVLASSGAQALQSNFEKLMAGRVDLVVENCNVGDYSLARFGLAGSIRKAGGVPTYRNGLYIGFNQDDPRVPGWIELINQRVNGKRANGELHSLLQVYGLRDWVQSRGIQNSPAQPINAQPDL